MFVQQGFDHTFESDVLKSEVPTLVDFYATWCGPCMAIAPLLEDLAEDLDGKVKFVKMNTDDESKTAAKMQVMALPTLMIFQGGKVVSKIVGARSKNDLSKWISDTLAI